VTQITSTNVIFAMKAVAIHLGMSVHLQTRTLNTITMQHPTEVLYQQIQYRSHWRT